MLIGTKQMDGFELGYERVRVILRQPIEDILRRRYRYNLDLGIRHQISRSTALEDVCSSLAQADYRIIYINPARPHIICL